MDKIPTSIIGLLGDILPKNYTKQGINSLFLASRAPEADPYSSKAELVMEWLHQINNVSDDPLGILGSILDNFMKKEQPDNASYSRGSEDPVADMEAGKKKILGALANDGLTYTRGGTITKGASPATLSLQESVKKHGLSSVDAEIQRALDKIESDPHAAAQYAGNALEASLKAYLDNKKKVYSNGDTLAKLWSAAAKEMGLRPKELDNKDLKKIASGLHSIVDGIAHLRNNKSSAHGKSEEQKRNILLKPRHARLAIHAAHTVSAYVLERIE